MNKKEEKELSSGLENTKKKIEELKCKDLSKDHLEGLFHGGIISRSKNLYNFWEDGSTRFVVEAKKYEVSQSQRDDLAISDEEKSNKGDEENLYEEEQKECCFNPCKHSDDLAMLFQCNKCNDSFHPDCCYKKE